MINLTTLELMVQMGLDGLAKDEKSNIDIHISEMLKKAMTDKDVAESLSKMIQSQGDK